MEKGNLYETRRMQNDTSQFVVNIIPLQNIQTNTSGIDATQSLSNSVANIQEMVNFDQKRVYTNFLSAYTAGNTIQVLSPMNMSNGDLTIGGTSVSGSTGSGSISTISAGSNSVNTSGSVSIITNGNTALSFSNNGYATFTGNVYAQQFITLSDSSSKTNIRSFDRPVLEGISRLEPKVFQYQSSPGFRTDEPFEVGLLAQEVESIFPECVKEGPGNKKYINYQNLTIILLKAVKDLQIKLIKMEGQLSGL